jgi:hypothetical protein
MKMIRELIIDEELKNLIPPLTIDEYEELKQSIRTYGFRPERGLILTWNNIIIDGYNRHQICRELEEETGTAFLDIEKHTREMDNLNTRLDVMLWMVRNQLGRRNLNSATRIDLTLKMESMFRDLARANQATSTGGANPQLLQNFAEAGKRGFSTRDELAKYSGSSTETIRKLKKIKENADPNLIEDVLSGRISIHAGFNEMNVRASASNIKLSTDADNEVNNITDAISGSVKNINTQLIDLIKDAKVNRVSEIEYERCEKLIQQTHVLLYELMSTIGN